MTRTIDRTEMMREQAFDQASDDGDYSLARALAEHARFDRLSTAQQLEGIRSANAQGVDVTSDAMRLLGKLESKVLKKGDAVDQSVFANIEFLESIINPDDVD